MPSGLCRDEEAGNTQPHTEYRHGNGSITDYSTVALAEITRTATGNSSGSSDRGDSALGHSLGEESMSINPSESQYMTIESRDRALGTSPLQNADHDITNWKKTPTGEENEMYMKNSGPSRDVNSSQVSEFRCYNGVSDSSGNYPADCSSSDDSETQDTSSLRDSSDAIYEAVPEPTDNAALKPPYSHHSVNFVDSISPITSVTEPCLNSHDDAESNSRHSDGGSESDNDTYI